MQSTRLLSASLFLAALIPAQTRDALVTVSPGDGRVRTVDPATATTLTTVQMVTTTNVNVLAANGLARDPISGILYGLVRLPGGSTRYLGRIDPVTGIVSNFNATTDNFAGLAFHSNGTLYGVTGDGASIPETLYTLNPATGASTFFATLGNGNDGETICFNPFDSMLYHASGFGTQNTQEVFERIDPTTGVPTVITLAGFDYTELISLVHWAGGNILGSDLNFDLMVVNTSGQVTRIGTLDHDAKGMAFVATPNTQSYLRPYGFGCAGTSNEIPMLFGTGTPTRGQTINLQIQLAPPASFGLLVFGFGTVAIPFPSVACQLQINPMAPPSLSYTTTPAGTQTLPLALPLGIAVGDYYFQTGLVDGAGFVVTNPLQVHVQ